jgi:ubiquinone/menaquinone biosynthesis C-methylase UbiE
MQYLIDFHRYAERQGPGSEEATLRALQSIPDYHVYRQVLDIGCGTGGQTLTLAKHISAARITAVDLLPDFLAELRIRAQKEGLSDRIEAVEGSMDALAFSNDTFDLVWAEGCIYHIGFERRYRSRYPAPA